MTRASYNHARWLKDRREMTKHLVDINKKNHIINLNAFNKIDE